MDIESIPLYVHVIMWIFSGVIGAHLVNFHITRIDNDVGFLDIIEIIREEYRNIRSFIFVTISGIIFGYVIFVSGVLFFMLYCMFLISSYFEGVIYRWIERGKKD